MVASHCLPLYSSPVNNRQIQATGGAVPHRTLLWRESKNLAAHLPPIDIENPRHIQYVIISYPT
jgi:hypothetical protein